MAQSNRIEIRKVEGIKGIKEFVSFHTELYKGYKYGMPYLFSGEIDTLNPEKNSAFAFCDAQYFMAYRDGKPVGRVAAIINKKANGKWNKKNVRFGWFDFVDDTEVCRALLDAVEQWGKERGMDHIVGPLGFTDMDREGMQVTGFDQDAAMMASFNYPYYPEHIEKLDGFVKDNDWVQYRIRVPEKMPDKFGRTAAIIEKKFNLHTYKFTRKTLSSLGGERIFQILNTCYADLYEFSELSREQIDQYIDSYIKIADTNLVSAVVDANKKSEEWPDGEIVAFGISFPSFTKALRKTGNGKLFPFGWWHLMRALFFHKTDVVDLYLIGVLPEYRTRGGIALIFRDLITQYQNYGFKEAETGPMMETNDQVLSVWQYMDSREAKRLRTFIKSIG